MLKNKHSLAIALAVWQAISFALMGVWVRMMNASFTVYQQVFWRSALAALICWLIFGVKFKKSTFRSLTRKDWLLYAGRSFLTYGVGVLLFTVAVLHANLAQVSFISSLPIVGLIAWVMFKEKLDLKALVWIQISVVGLILVTGLSPSSLHLGIGTLAAVLSMLGFDISYLMVRHHPKTMSNVHNTTLILTFAWIPAFVLMLVSHQSIMPANLDRLAFIGFVFSVLLNISGVYVLNFIFSNLKGYVAGNILLLEGVFAFIVGYIAYGEKLNTGELAGAVIIMVCTVMISRNSLQQKELAEVEL
jgi:drug/metabolite transporter (DMT)-like permease